MPKEKVNYQEVYDLYQLCSETKDLKEFCSEYGVNYDKFMNSNWNLHLKSRSELPIRLKCDGSDVPRQYSAKEPMTSGNCCLVVSKYRLNLENHFFA